MNIYEQKKRLEAKEIDMLNHLLGQYIGAAVNNPKKYPRKPFLSNTDAKPKPMTAEQMEEMAKKLNSKFGGENK